MSPINVQFLYSFSADSDDSTNDVDPDEPSTSKGAGTSKGAERRPTWRNRDAADIQPKRLEFAGAPAHPSDSKEPIGYFRELIDQDLLVHIVEESNLYALQEDINKPLNLTTAELEQFIAILFQMSIVKMPQARMYWSKECRYALVADIMPVNRFEEIKRLLHLNDNSKMPPQCEDKLYKVRPLVDNLASMFRNIVAGEMLAADEQVIPFKGKSSLKTYNPKKPKKWGYKVYVLCGADGLIANFEFYTGKIEHVDGQPDLKASGNIVLCLLESVPRGLWHKLFTDNWFTSPVLYATLHKQQIACVGTVRANRLLGCVFPTDKALKAQGRGAFALMSTTFEGVDLSAVKWHDNKCVSLLSTYCAIEPMDTAERWDKTEKDKVAVPRPHIVATYNKFMGGADLLDSLLALYRIPVRSKKYYHRIIWHFLDTAVVQAWLLYRRNMAADGIAKKLQMTLLQFKASISRCLAKEGKVNGVKRGRPSCSMDIQIAAKAKRGPMAALPDTAIRTDALGHWPVFMNKGRCNRPGCKGTPKVKCEKCNTYLCFTTSSNL